MKRSVLELLEESERKRASHIAFGDEVSEITFSELKHGAQSVGTFLAGKTKPGQPVAFYLEKSTVAIRGMFGAVYAGGFYSVLDVRQPKIRTQSVLQVLEPEVLLTDRKHYEAAKELDFSGEVYCIEDYLSYPADEKRLGAIREQAVDTDPLYVNFTSGSTGVPKGVTVCHRSVLEFIDTFVEIFGITEEDIIGNQAPFDFDVSVKDIYSGLAAGARVQIIPRNYFSMPMQLMDYLAEHQVTTLIWAVSAMCFVSIMNGFAYRVPEDVNKVLFSGEVLPVKHLNVWKKYLPGAMFVNLYGPTEITCNCTYYILDREYALDETLPIGKAFPNEKVFLLDEKDELVTEEGVQGEICVSGTAVAQGYYRDPERTAQVFVQNPLNRAYYERMYRSGDLGRLDEEGNLVYISRKDFQVKHLGHRIELGEIETAAGAQEKVSRACCLYDSEKKRLLLFYTGELDKTELLHILKEILPPFMIPNVLYPVEEMPMNKNGKIDRGKLMEMTKKRRHV